MAGRVYLICEHNEALSRPALWDSLRLSLGLTQTVNCRDFASVWAAAKPLDPEEEDLSRMATKLLGPLPLSQAYEVIDRMRQVLEEAGLSVSVEEVADD
jgi:hypothetical protein